MTVDLTDGVNLDAMTVDELDELASADLFHVGSSLWPDADPDEALEWAAIVTSYAQVKAKAMGHRLAGRIQKAMDLESNCDGLYDKLPVERRPW